MSQQKTKMTEFTQLQELDPASTAQEAAPAILGLEISPRLQRASQVSEAIDPTHTLPSVEIVNDPSTRVGRGSLVPRPSLIIYNGETIGRCTVVSDNMARARWFNGIEVNEKGKGFGTAAYKTVIEQAMRDGYDFQTHEWSQTEGAKKVWERLAQAGVARVEDEFTPDGNGKFNGRYVVDAVK